MSRDRDASAGVVFAAFLKLGLTSFGGPVAHLGYFRDEFVDRRGWVAAPRRRCRLSGSAAHGHAYPAPLAITPSEPRRNLAYPVNAHDRYM